MSDEDKPCPSCREPLSYPSGDGCANMTAHKERAMTSSETTFNDAEQIAEARARIRAYIDRRAVSKAYDPEHIHGYDAGCSGNPEGISLTVSDLTALLDALEAADARIEALTEQLAAARQDAKEAEAYAEELQEVIDRKAALLADAYGADLDWEEILKQRADHEAVNRIEQLEAKLETSEEIGCAFEEDAGQLREKLAKAAEVLEQCEIMLRLRGHDEVAAKARTTLAEIKSSKAAPPYGLEGENHD